MTRLRAADLEAVLSFLEEAQTIDGPAPFTTELLDLLAETVGCTFATFTEVDHRSRVVHRVVLCSADPWNGKEDDDDAWWESPRTVTLSRHRLSDGAKPVIVLSDFFSRAQRTSVDFNPNFQEGVSDEIQIDLDPTRTWFACLNVASDRDFGDRERLLLHRLRPHLIGLYRSAELRRRLGATAAAAAFDPDATDRLTRRECEVMLWVAGGLSNAEIASVLVVERCTVRKHLENIYEKLGVRSRTAALAKVRAAVFLPTSN